MLITVKGLTTFASSHAILEKRFRGLYTVSFRPQLGRIAGALRDNMFYVSICPTLKGLFSDDKVNH